MGHLSEQREFGTQKNAPLTRRSEFGGQIPGLDGWNVGFRGWNQPP